MAELSIEHHHQRVRISKLLATTTTWKCQPNWLLSTSVGKQLPSRPYQPDTHSYMSWTRKKRSKLHMHRTVIHNKPHLFLHACRPFLYSMGKQLPLRSSMFWYVLLWSERCQGNSSKAIQQFKKYSHTHTHTHTHTQMDNTVRIQYSDSFINKNENSIASWSGLWCNEGSTPILTQLLLPSYGSIEREAVARTAGYWTFLVVTTETTEKYNRLTMTAWKSSVLCKLYYILLCTWTTRQCVLRGHHDDTFDTTWTTGRMQLRSCQL